MESVMATVKDKDLMFTFLGCAEDSITKHHLKFGSFYEQEPLQRLVNLVNKLMTISNDGYIIDAGANIGNHTLYFGGACSLANVYSFEMNPVTFDYLKRNALASQLKNLTIYNQGLSSKEGRCGVRQNQSNPLGGAQLDFSVNNSSDVDITTLDYWFEKSNINSRCLLIKMDVEGHEFDVLKGGINLIKNSKPMIYAELKEVGQFKEISEFLFSLGYVVAYAEKGALPNFLFVQKSEITKLFDEIELESIKHELCSRVVDSWQLHRQIRALKA